MYGWRAKIGFIVPANNTVIEPELYSMVPQGVSLHFTKLSLRQSEGDPVDKGGAVKLLASGGVDVIVYACMSGSLAEATDWESATSEQTGIPTTSAATALAEGIRALNATRIAVVTHYPESLLTQVREWLQNRGLAVAAVESLGISDAHAVCEIPAESVYRLARRANQESTELVCLLATDLRTIPILQKLEEDLGKPVISSNQALLWRAMRLVGIKESIKGYGVLFDN